MNEAEWKSTDPRESINKRARIVIVSCLDRRAFTADVDTKETWTVLLNGRGKDERQAILPDEPWPERWLWTYESKF
jgi:hypothetical protein